MDDLNTRNTHITTSDVQQMLKICGINKTPKDIKLYQKSFTHKSYVKEKIYDSFSSFVSLNDDVVDFQNESNERFEFAGDSVICHTVCEYLFLRYRDYDEGFLTKLKTIIVSRDYLAKFALFYGFDKYVLISNHIENINGRKTLKIMEDCFESFICAMNMDLGYEITKKFILATVENCVNFSELLFINKNYKDRVLNYMQKNGWGFPKYKQVAALGPPNKRTFIIEIFYEVDGKKKVVCRGYGNTKKDAEQHGSYCALEIYNQISVEEKKLM